MFRDVCLFVAMFVCLSAPADGAAAASVLLQSSSRLLRSSSKVKAGQWVTPNPTRPTIHDQIC